VAHVVVITWAPGGNLPPLLAAGSVLAARGHRVEVMTSAETKTAAERAGFGVVGYPRSPAPDTSVAFERQAEAMLGAAAGADIAADVRDVLLEARPDLAIVDCMLPAGIAAGQATGTPTVSLVHFLYGLARQQMLRGGGAWTTDLGRLSATHRALGLPEVSDGLAAWETPDLLLVTAPRWLDVDVEYPAHVVHAGPLGVRTRAAARSRVLLSFSTTVMDEQVPALQCACDALAECDVRAVLTLGPAVDRAALRTPDSVEVVAFADHDELLPQCAAVITHGGLGTTLRALAHGVPMVLLPLGRDQEFNATRVAGLGAGIPLAPGRRPADVRAALETVLGDPSFAAAAAGAAARIAADEPDRTAARALEHLTLRPPVST
jgi:UDP:flavonoid glycosyltransferase YjiC (YdhE family)